MAFDRVGSETRELARTRYVSTALPLGVAATVVATAVTWLTSARL